MKFISCVSKSVQNLNLTSSQNVMRVMNVRSIKLKFTLDAIVTIVFSTNFMNEQTQNNRQRSRFFFMKSFLYSTKRKLSILLNSLFPFFVFNGVFLTLKYRTLVLKTSA